MTSLENQESLPNTLGENVGSKRKQFDEKQGSLVVNRRSSSVLSNLSEEEFLAIYSGNYERPHFSLACCIHLLLFCFCMAGIVRKVNAVD